MSSDMLKRLRESRLRVWEEAKEIADRAADENRSFSGEEESKWQALQAEIQAYDKRIAAVLEGEKRAKDAEDKFNDLMAKPKNPAQTPEARGTGGQVGASVDEELRNFLTGRGPNGYAVQPSGKVNFRQLAEQRVLVKGTASAGGNTVPTSFYDQLMIHLIDNATMMQICKTVATNSGESLQVPKTTAHSTGVVITAENTAISSTDPTFGQTTLGAFKYGVLLQLSRELIEDTGVDLEGYLAQEVGEALGNAFGAHLVTGTGTTQPRGVTIDSTLGVTGGAGVGGKFTSDDLISLHYSVIAPYRRNATWLMRDATVAEVRKLKDANGQYLWQPALTAGSPDMLLGKEVYTDPNVAAVATSAKSVVFGDFSRYFVRMVNGVRFERSNDFAFNTDLVTFRGLIRGDGALIDLTGAVKHFVGNAA